jgi:multidrug resistance efflux pump
MRYQLSEGNILDRLQAMEAKLASREHELRTLQQQFNEYRSMVKQQFYDIYDDQTSQVYLHAIG